MIATTFWILVGMEVDEDAGATNYIDHSGLTNVSDGQWHHVVSVRKGDTLILYVDGKNDGSKSGAGTANISNSAEFRIGLSSICNSTNNGNSIDEYRVYNRALTPAEIQRLYNMGK